MERNRSSEISSPSLTINVHVIKVGNTVLVWNQKSKEKYQIQVRKTLKRTLFPSASFYKMTYRLNLFHTNIILCTILEKSEIFVKLFYNLLGSLLKTVMFYELTNLLN